MTQWTYEGFWNVVMGANRSASMVVAEFGLVGEVGLDEWLDNAMGEAWRVGGEGGLIPESWTGEFHARALAELREAVQS